MRILSVYYTHKPGGFCKRLYRALGALAASGDQVEYLALDRPPPNFQATVTWRQIPFPLSRRQGVLFWALFLLWAPLYTAYRAHRQRTDHLVVFGAFYAALCLPARLVRRAPLTVFLRSIVSRINEITKKPRHIQAISDFIDKIGIASASTVVVMSGAMQREVAQFMGRPLSQVKLLPNDLPAVPVRGATSPLPASPLRLLTAGVVDERKNIAVLLEAIALLEQRIGPDKVTLAIAGDGPLLGQLRARSAELKLQRCQFLGWVENVGDLFEKTDLLVHPSLHEGAPNAVLEAVAAGLPVLVSDIPELRELFPFNELLFPPHASHILADVLEQLAKSPERWERQYRLSSQCAEKLRFDWNARIREIVHGLERR